ncbi:DUF2188 domain-containing protein [Dongia sp.]|uniref:DUF2188 domain-containing protein n=1 Tax=Dongia sp. TaxID=1977262 RepID=UPI0035AE74C0
MALVQYVIGKHEGRWKISYEGKHHGSYDTQHAATRQAIDWAQEVGGKGHSASVLIKGEDGRFRTEWTYGKDPYPPKG